MRTSADSWGSGNVSITSEFSIRNKDKDKDKDRGNDKGKGDGKGGSGSDISEIDRRIQALQAYLDNARYQKLTPPTMLVHSIHFIIIFALIRSGILHAADSPLSDR